MIDRSQYLFLIISRQPKNRRVRRFWLHLMPLHETRHLPIDHPILLEKTYNPLLLKVKTSSGNFFATQAALLLDLVSKDFFLQNRASEMASDCPEGDSLEFSYFHNCFWLSKVVSLDIWLLWRVGYKLWQPFLYPPSFCDLFCSWFSSVRCRCRSENDHLFSFCPLFQMITTPFYSEFFRTTSVLLISINFTYLKPVTRRYIIRNI